MMTYYQVRKWWTTLENKSCRVDLRTFKQNRAEGAPLQGHAQNQRRAEMEELWGKLSCFFREVGMTGCLPELLVH